MKTQRQPDGADTLTSLFEDWPSIMGRKKDETKEGGPGSGPHPGQGHGAHSGGAGAPRVFGHKPSGHAKHDATWVSKAQDAGLSKAAQFVKTLTNTPGQVGALSKHEGDSASGVPQAMLIPDVKSSRESAALSFKGKFREALVNTTSDSADSPAPPASMVGTKFRCVLLQEGLGNFGDAYFYSKGALESAVPIFEGKKIYADHPSTIDEQSRPERSVKDVLGHFENVSLQENDVGQAELQADVIVLPDEPFDWARSLMKHSVDYSKKYPDMSFIGLSISAAGDAAEAPIDDLVSETACEPIIEKLQQAKANGIETVRVVSVITDAVSCDLVTEAGAGGKILNILEQRKGIQMKKKLTEGQDKPEEKKVEGEDAPPPASDKKDDKKDAAPAPAASDKKDVAPAAKDGDPAPDKSDAEEDKELIASMLKKYVGGDEHDEETMKMASEAYKTCAEAGMNKDDACETAGHSVKMAKMLAKKKEDMAAAEAAKEADAVAEAGEPSPDKLSAEAKESEVLKLRGENAKLKESLKAIETEKYVEEKLSESKLSRAVTKSFRESAGTFRSKEDFDSKFKMFSEGYGSRGGEASVYPWIAVEKNTSVTTGSGLDFSKFITK